MDDTSGPGDGEGNAYSRQHIALGRGHHRRGQRDPRHATSPASWCSARGPARRPSRGSSPTSTTGSRSWPPEGATAVVLAPIGFVSRPHGGRLRPRHRGRGDGRAARAAASCGCRPSASTPSSSPAWSTSCWSAPPQARGEEPVRPAWPGRDADAVGVRPRAAAPTCARPSRRSAGGTDRGLATPRPRRPDDADAGEPRARSPSSVAVEAGRLIVDERPAEPGRLQDQEHRHRRGHGDGPARRRTCCAPGCTRPGPRTASSARRRAAPTGRSGDHLGRRPHRRHGQLPLRHPVVCRVRRRRRRRPPHARGLATRGRRGRQPGHRRALPRAGTAAVPGSRADAAPRRRLRARLTRRTSGTPWWAPASATTPARRHWQAHGAARACCREVRDIRRIGSAALDICAVAAGSLDAYFERGLNPWDMAAAWLVLTEAGGVFTGLGRRATQRPDGGRGGAHAAYRPARGGAPARAEPTPALEHVTGADGAVRGLARHGSSWSGGACSW